MSRIESLFGEDARVAMPDWVRRGREADITDIPMGKILDASERGVVVEVTKMTPDQVCAQVDKIVLEGDH